MLSKYKLNTIKFSISKASISSNISHDKFGSVNNVLKEYSHIKKAIQNSENINHYNM